MVELFVATGNRKKLLELEHVLAAAQIDGVSLRTMNDFPHYNEPVEDGATFTHNALIKAHAGAKATGYACIADDSGLAIDALNGMPGIFSARWAGLSAEISREEKDIVNRDLVLAQINEVPDSRRGAYFISVCALVTPAGQEFVGEGRWLGTILRTAQGIGGFGYDPIFQPADTPGLSAAELSSEQKNQMSHRAKALGQLISRIRPLISTDSI